MVDAAACGWHDSNGVLSKITIEKHILPLLNQKLGIEKIMPSLGLKRLCPISK